MPFLAESRALPVERKDGWHKEGDEVINDAIEEAAKNARLQRSMPTTQKAVIKFGYEEGMKAALGGEDFDTYIAGVFTHTQAHFRHSDSLGTTIEFEVCIITVMNNHIPELQGMNLFLETEIINTFVKSLNRYKGRLFFKQEQHGQQMIISTTQKMPPMPLG